MGALVIQSGLCGLSEIGTLGAFFEPASVAKTDLVRSDEQLILNLVGVIDKQLLSLLEARTEKEFVKTRDKVLPKYVRSLRALHDTVSNLVPPDQIERLSRDAIISLTEDLNKQTMRFGEKLKEQAIFTLWTVGKMHALARKIDACPKLSHDKKKIDSELLASYATSAYWAQFHMDALVAAVKFDRPVRESVREQMCDGLRAAVNAFAIARDALALRLPQGELAGGDLPWDEEDERLLAMSMRDINVDSSDDND